MIDGDAGGELAAGDFSDWRAQMEGALRGERDADVPCDSCTACCSASQFVPVGPEESDTLAHIAPALLFPAPRSPRGHVLLGYDEHGRCPMLVDDRCSIYAHRPRACRTYDCRVFAAAGLDVGEGDASKAGVARRVRRWRFAHPSAQDRVEHEAVRSAAAFVGAHPELFPDDGGPATTTQRAVLAVELHAAFVGCEPDVPAVRIELTRRREARALGLDVPPAGTSRP